MRRKSKRGAPPGNQRAAKPDSERRVTMTVRVLPATRAALDAMAAVHGSLSRAVDALVTHSAPGTSTPTPTA